MAFFALQRPDGQLPAYVKRDSVGFGQIQMVVPHVGTVRPARPLSSAPVSSLGLIGPEADLLHPSQMSRTEGFSISRLEGGHWWVRRRGYGERTLTGRWKADWVFAESSDAMPSGRFSELGKLENVVHRAARKGKCGVQAHERVSVPGAHRVVADGLWR